MIRAGLPPRIVALLAKMCIFQSDRKKRKLRMGVPYLIYVIRVELHHAVGLLGFLRRRNKKHTHPFIVVCMMDRLACCLATPGKSMLLSYGLGRGRGLLKALLAPLFGTFDTLLGGVGGDVGQRLPVAARGHLPASLGRAKHDRLVASGALGGNAVRLLEHVPEEVTTSALSRALRVALRHQARATLASLALSWMASRRALASRSRPEPS
jgi:hypothetical protein